MGEDWGYISAWHQKIQGTVRENFAKNPQAANVHEVANVDANMNFLFGPTGVEGRLEIRDREVANAIQDAFWVDLVKLFNTLKANADSAMAGTPVVIDDQYNATLVDRNGMQVLVMDGNNYYGNLNNFFAVMKQGQAQTGVDVEGSFNGNTVTVTGAAETSTEFEKRFFAEASAKHKAWLASPEGQAHQQQEAAKQAEAQQKLAEAKAKYAQVKDTLATLENRTEETVKVFNEDWDYISVWHQKIQDTVRDNFAKNPQAANVHEVENVDANMNFLFGSTGTGGRLEINDKEVADAIQQSFWADLEKLFNDLKASADSAMTGEAVVIDSQYKATLVDRKGAKVLVMDSANWYGSRDNFFAVMKKGQKKTGVNVEGSFNGTTITVTSATETTNALEVRFLAEADAKHRAWELSPEGKAHRQQEAAKQAEAQRKLAEAKAKFAQVKDSLVGLANRTEATAKLFNEDWGYMSAWHQKIQGTLRENFAKNPQAASVHEVQNVDANMNFLFGPTGVEGRLEIQDREVAAAIQDAFWADLVKLFNTLKADADKATVAHVTTNKKNPNDLGGIDFNAAHLDLQIKRDGKGVPLPISQQDLENIHIDGLIPVIVSIKPAVESPLGIQQ